MSVKPIPALSPPSELALRFGHHPDCGEGADFPWDCTCDYAGAYWRVKASMALDAAWQEAVDALPAHTGLALHKLALDGWAEAVASPRGADEITVQAESPATALLGLAAKLRAQQ